MSSPQPPTPTPTLALALALAPTLAPTLALTRWRLCTSASCPPNLPTCTSRVSTSRHCLRSRPVRAWRYAGKETGGLSLRPAGAPEASLSARPRPRLPQAPASLGQSTSRAALAGHIVLGLRPRYVKLMRRMQIKKMTFKERRKLWTYNGKKNKLGKETARWK